MATRNILLSKIIMNKTMKTPCLLIPLLLLAACNNPEQPAEKTTTLPTIKAQTVSVITAPAPHTLEVTGTIQAVQRAVISTRIAADIINIPVTTGELVKKGDILVELDEGNLQAVVKEAHVAAAQAQRNLQRETRLLKKHAATAESVKNLQDTLRIAQAKLSQAKEALGYARLQAPFSGVITAKHVNSGDLALPGLPLLSMENPHHFEVVANIPETLLGAVQQGDTISFTIPSLHATLNGRVKEISPALNPVSRTAAAKLSIDDQDRDLHLYSGMFAAVELPAQKTVPKTLFIPEKALSHYGQIEQVFVWRKGKAVMRIVRTGATRLQDGVKMIEILSGLDAEEKILISTGRLQNGQPVEITDKN